MPGVLTLPTEGLGVEEKSWEIKVQGSGTETTEKDNRLRDYGTGSD